MKIRNLLIVCLMVPAVAYGATQVFGSIKVGTISGLGTDAIPPGMVPLGGMVAVMPSTHANAWQPPASGAIKDGFMRADGATIDATDVSNGCVFPAGTVLPNMVGSFAKGTATTTGTATAAQKLVAANIPQVSTNYTPAGTELISGTVGGTNDGTHTHTITDPGHGHRMPSYVAGTAFAVGGVAINSEAYADSDSNSTTGISINATNSGHSHTFALTSAFTGTQATITDGTAVGSQTVVPDPANVTVIWVIRVK